MSNINFLEKLLDGVNIEWLPVSELFHIKNGYTPSKSKKEFWENGAVPWFRMDDIRENGKILNDSLQKVSESAIKGGKLFPANSIIIATSATIGEHALITLPYLANQRFTNLTVKRKYNEILNPKFLFYYCFLLAEWCKKTRQYNAMAELRRAVDEYIHYYNHERIKLKLNGQSRWNTEAGSRRRLMITVWVLGIRSEDVNVFNIIKKTLGEN